MRALWEFVFSVGLCVGAGVFVLVCHEVVGRFTGRRTP